MLGLLSQPKPQTADSAIYTLCDRLSHSLLIEDRKAAVLALRGMAHENRELVASNGLQGLLEVLIKDSHDTAAAKATLETLLILFNTETRRKTINKRYVSALVQRKNRELSAEPQESVAGDISLWLTDRLLHSQDALDRVLELTTTREDPFTAVYALQLISVMTYNRPLEAKQVMMASGGIASLVSALGSVQTMVRDEALLLLNALTADNLELQKLVAFEGGFDKAFHILSEGGGPVFGGSFAEDCLSLVANLLEYNASNQKLFTQSGYVQQWAGVLEAIVDALNEGPSMREQAISNIEAGLVIGQLLCVAGADGTASNQNILNESGVLTLALQIAFGPSSPPPVRVSALITCASLINNNDARQSDMLAMDVPYYDFTVRKVVAVEPRVVPVAQALLNWTVSLNASHLFDLRCASLLCLSSIFNENRTVKTAFVTEQIELYFKLNENPGEHHDVNLVETLAEYSDDTRLNPFRIWFAAAVTMRLFINAPEIKDLLRSVKIGEESLGMDVHSLIQAIAGEMQSSLKLPEPTVALGYLQLLAVWTYDDVEAVNDFTQESSAVQTLLAHQTSNPLVESVAIVVLGILYAFCTKDSPISRGKFHHLLTHTLGRDQYIQLVKKFRQSHAFQFFDESSMFGAHKHSNGSPAVYLDAAFVGLMRDTIGYISRAIDANPEIEPSSRVTFEMLDEVKHSLHEKTHALALSETQLAEIRKEHQDVRTKLRDLSEKASAHESLLRERTDYQEKLDKEHEVLQRSAAKLESSLAATKRDLEARTLDLSKLESANTQLKAEISSLSAAKTKADEGVNNLTRELFQLQRAKETMESEASKTKSEVSKLKPKLETALKSEADLKKRLQSSQTICEGLGHSLREKEEVNERLITKIRETAAILKKTESEDEELRTKFSKMKIDFEAQGDELSTLKNREASARKSLEVAMAELEKLKDTQTTVNRDSVDQQKELDSLKIKLVALELQAKSSDLAERQLEAKLKAAESELAELSNTHNATKAKLDDSMAEVDSLQAEAKVKEQASTSLKGSHEKLKEVNSKLIKDLAELKKIIAQQDAHKTSAQGPQAVSNQPEKSEERHQDDLEKLRSELSEKQEALDELMILLDDLTEKKTIYKSRLRKMQQEVSDSEEDED